MLGGSSRVDLNGLQLKYFINEESVSHLQQERVWMNISPPWEVSMCEIIFVLDVLFTISSMTERPESRKLVRQEDCLELTSVGVMR